MFQFVVFCAKIIKIITYTKKTAWYFSKMEKYHVEKATEMHIYSSELWWGVLYSASVLPVTLRKCLWKLLRSL